MVKAEAEVDFLQNFQGFQGILAKKFWKIGQFSSKNPQETEIASKNASKP